MLDLHKLQIFSVVAQEGSFSAAAQRLYITQSAVSQHIKDLEASLGQPLFQRGWRGVRLTPQGEILQHYAREIFALVASAQNALTDVEHLAQGKISIGTTPGISIYLAPDWIQQFRARYPQLTAALQTGVTAQVVADVLAHRLDIGVIEGEVEEFRQARLAHLVLEEIEQRVVVGFRHPFWDMERIRLEDLRGQSFIVRQPNSHSRIWLDRALRQHGIEANIGAEFDNLEAIKRALLAGMCLAILPPYVVQSEAQQGLLRSLPIEGRPFTRSLKLIWDSQFYFSPIVRAFLGELAQQYPTLDALLRAG